MLTGLALIKEVKRANAVMVHPNQRVGLVQCNPYAIVQDKRRNCYNCGRFGYLAQNCRRQIMGQNKRMEYKDNKNHRQNNLNRERDLIVLD